MPPKGTKKSAHHHDKRHENGLAPPGRRIHKSRSNGHLNGHATASSSQPHPATPPPNQQPAQLAYRSAAPPAAVQTGDGTAAAHDMAGSPSDGCHGSGAYQPTSDLAADGRDSYRYRNGCVDAAGRAPWRRTERSGGAYKTGAGLTDVMRLATTIVTSCPLCDVIAILIILLQLPPTLLTIVDALFAVLTFVPPTTGASLSALPSLSDMFQGSGGRHSLWTMVFLDIVALFAWLFLWVPAQNIALDLAQVVIAISLGGAAAGRGGTMHAVLLCLGLIFPYHAFRHKPTRRFGVKVVFLGLSRAGLRVPSADTDSSLLSTPDRTEVAPSLFQDVLGVHILTQGVTRLIVRALSHHEPIQARTPGKKTDPEAAGASRAPRRNSAGAESGADHPSNTSTDGRPPGPSPAARDGKEKASQARRKKRRSAHVRSQQPFWAAVASAKVTFLKQKEQNQASLDAAEASALDDHVGNTNFRSEEDRVWVSELGATEVSFGVSLVPPEVDGDEDDPVVGLGIDKSKPFYVRVNGAAWSSTRIRGRQSPDNGSMGVWEGEIFGLTALSNYYCEFVSTASNRVIHSTSLVTHPAPSTEQASVVAQPGHQSLRPSSPTTTLRNSIAAAEQNLQEHRNRLKRNRKEHKASITSSKKEVDNLTNRLSSSGGTDDKQRQRALQFNQNVRQAEEATAELTEAINALGDIPEEQHLEHDAMKRRWQQENERKATFKTELDRCKADAERQLASIRADIASTIQKRDRLQMRQAKLNEQHDRLMSANAQGYDAKARKENERAAQAAHRAAMEQQFINVISRMEHQLQDLRTETSQHIHQLELAYKQAQQPLPMPVTAEGFMPGLVMANSGIGRGGPNFATFQFPAMHAQVGEQFRVHPISAAQEVRGRSSSMLSDVSGFTDDLADASSPPMMASPAQVAAIVSASAPIRTGSKASSGSGGSQRDPMSPGLARASSALTDSRTAGERGPL